MVEAESEALEITLVEAGNQTEGVDTVEPVRTSERAMNRMGVADYGEPGTILGEDGSLTAGVDSEVLEIILAAAGSPMAEVGFVAPEIISAEDGSGGKHESTSE